MLITALAVLPAACTSEVEPPSALPIDVDVVVVENPAAEPLGWHVASEPELSIGTAEGDDAYQLFRVRDATVLADGRIAVANQGTGEIRVFDRDGTHVVSMGGPGEGPGEFRSLIDVEPWPGDSIIGWDLRQRRISVFDGDGAHARTFRVRDFEDSFAPQFRGVTRDGRLLIQAGFPRRDDEPYKGMFRAERRYVLADGEGTHSASLGSHPGPEQYLVAGGGWETTFGHPHGKTTHSAAWGDLVLISPNDSYELHAFDVEGRLARIVRLEHDAGAPTRADMEAWFDEYTANDTPEERATFREDFEEFPLLESFPAFSEILVDAVDHVWVRDYERPGDDSVSWVVFDPEGVVLGRIDTPPELEIYDIGADYLLGRVRDDFNVEYVTRWSLTR